MKNIIALAAALLAMNSYAINYEVGVGQMYATTPVNGLWYEKGWWNEWNTKSNSAYVGVTDTLDWSSRYFSRVRWRVGFQYLGQVSSDALVTNDGDYNGVNGCVPSGCTSMVRMKTEGSVRGVMATLAPEWYLGGGRTVYVEGGVFAYVPKIDVWFADTRTPNDENHYEYKGGVNASLVLGIGYSIDKRWSISFRAYGIDATNDKPICDKCTVPPNMSPSFGDTKQLLLNYRF